MWGEELAVGKENEGMRDVRGGEVVVDKGEGKNFFWFISTGGFSRFFLNDYS